MITRRYTQRYIFALSLVAGLTIVGQVLVQQQLRNQTSDSYLVNYAGRQRYQSQQIAKDVLLLTNGASFKSNSAVQAELTTVLSRWERYHRELKSGHLTDLNVQLYNSKNIRKLFGQLDPHFQVISEHAHRLLTLTRQPDPSTEALQSSVREILAHEQDFLQIMDAIVRQYAHEAEVKIEQLRGIEHVLLAITLFVLLLEALLIFYPAVQILRQTIGQLTHSEQETRQVNEQLRQANESLQVTQKQLVQEITLRHEQRLNEQRIRLSSVVQGQEEERKRLSRELHDGIGQMLTGLKLLSENIRSANQLTEKDQSTFANLKTLLVRTIQETRHVSNNLMPPALSDFGLVSALRQLIEQQDRQSTASVSLQTSLTNERFGQPVEIGLYRIVQEAVNNAVKHASAAHIDVSLELRQDRLFLRITDDGCGLPAVPKSRTTHGLHNMRGRARLLDGTFRIMARAGTTRPGLAKLNGVYSGTRVLVSIPVTAHPSHNVATQPVASTEA
ncbi:hypothetical protein HNV11_21745 [Spirosoma taeanense]|uniref:histidine kinase n=1 Tax=Spirosoma taeanense TaxID=2735870 RepID=A0A6M5YCM5_9BACT|nr:histidine kinase [Spirosoma taeanense]QJW91815.1 hypothetical protein HNV11_21745 [Spirosoma taeanense]